MVQWIGTNQQSGDDFQNKYNILLRTAKFVALWRIINLRNCIALPIKKGLKKLVHLTLHGKE